MGREQGRGRQHLLLYIACIIGMIQIVAGCAQVTGKLSITTALAKAHNHMESGDFHSALMENEKALRNPFPVSRSRILFQRGLIMVHPSNPERDYTGAAVSFQEVVDQYPTSDFSAASKILLLWLCRTQTLEEVDHKLSAEVARLKHALKEQQGVIGQYQREITGRQEQIDNLNSQIEDLKGQIENYKKIDLNIEKKKQDTKVQ